MRYVRGSHDREKLTGFHHAANIVENCPRFVRPSLWNGDSHILPDKSLDDIVLENTISFICYLVTKRHGADTRVIEDCFFPSGDVRGFMHGSSDQN